MAINEYSSSIERFDRLRSFSSTIISAEALILAFISFILTRYSTLPKILLFLILVSLFCFLAGAVLCLFNIAPEKLVLISPHTLIEECKEGRFNKEEVAKALLVATSWNVQQYEKCIRRLKNSICLTCIGLSILVLCTSLLILGTTS